MQAISGAAAQRRVLETRRPSSAAVQWVAVLQTTRLRVSRLHTDSIGVNNLIVMERRAAGKPAQRYQVTVHLWCNGESDLALSPGFRPSASSGR